MGRKSLSHSILSAYFYMCVSWFVHSLACLLHSWFTKAVVKYEILIEGIDNSFIPLLLSITIFNHFFFLWFNCESGMGHRMASLLQEYFSVPCNDSKSSCTLHQYYCNSLAAGYLAAVAPHWQILFRLHFHSPLPLENWFLSPLL